MSRAGEFLHIQFNSKKNRNRRYSQRTFSTLIGINSGRLTQYFSGDRLITKAAAKKIAAKLKLDDEQLSYFLHLCDADEAEKLSPQLKVVGNDELSLLVEWHHYAIYSLTSTKDFRLDYDWIAGRLCIPKELVVSSLQTLERVGMIKIENGVVHPVPGPFTTSNGVPNIFLRLSHQDILRYIIENMPKVPLEKRDISSITLAIDEKKLPAIKNTIRTFRRKLASQLTQGKKNQVYSLNIQFFPFTHEVQK